MDDEVDYDELLADAEQEETFYDDYQDDIEAELAMEAEVTSCGCLVPIRRTVIVVLFLLLESSEFCLMRPSPAQQPHKKCGVSRLLPLASSFPAIFSSFSGQEIIDPVEHALPNQIEFFKARGDRLSYCGPPFEYCHVCALFSFFHEFSQVGLDSCIQTPRMHRSLWGSPIAAHVEFGDRWTRKALVSLPPLSRKS